MNDNLMNDNDYNPPDIHGVHQYRFKWKNITSQPPKNIKNIIMKLLQKTPKYYYEIFNENTRKTELQEIHNLNTLDEINKISNNFKVIGAKGRNIIIGEINLKELSSTKGAILILSSLTDWKKYLELKGS
jgi:predicted nucleic acid-binding OB-fold protein